MPRLLDAGKMMPVDTAALRARLREYAPSAPRCSKKVAEHRNYAPDHMRDDDPEWSDFTVTTYAPCCRPAGHAGECRNSRRVMGWPGLATLTALIDEVEDLRAWRSDVEEDFRRVTSEACEGDERHCSCVPHLQKHVRQLREAIHSQAQLIIADQSAGREAGITHEAVRDIMCRHLRDDDDGTSFGRMVEELRGLAMGAAVRLSAGNEGG